MMMYRGLDVQINVFFTLALLAGEFPISRPYRFIPGERAASTN
jgi:hypothetical protein